MCSYPIEKNVPIPKSLAPIPFASMEPGDSVLIPLTKGREDTDYNTITQRVYRQNYRERLLILSLPAKVLMAKKTVQKRYSCFKVDEKSVRVFRIT